MTIYQVRALWTGPSSPLLTTMFFDQAGGTAAQAASAAATFLGTADNFCSTAFSWTLDTEVRELDHLSGTLTAVDTVSSASGTGGQANERLDLIQGLVVWSTGAIVRGRPLKGRTFLPGMTEANNDTDGTPIASYLSGINTPAAALIADANSVLVVWSRPVKDPTTHAIITNGSFRPATAGTTSDKWAYLSSRRQ